MADYQEFRRKARRRRIKKRLLAGAIVAAGLALVAGVIWLVLSFTGVLAPRPAEADSAPAASVAADSSAPGVADSVSASASDSAAPAQPAATDFVLAPATADTNWNTSAYAVRTLDYTVQPQGDGTTAMDFRLVAQEACGRIDTSYYNHVTFMGDSLTQGLELYPTGLPEAQYCAYKGIGPQAVVNGTTCTRLSGAKEIPLEALATSAPDAVYVLFGTNVLVRDGDYSSFLAYYSQMIDMIKEAVPGIKIYIQSITPVRPEVAAERPGLYNTRLMAVNDELAALAKQKGCYFLDLWEVLADSENNLVAEYAAADGIHMNPTGYEAWVQYLRTHTVYTPGAVYEPGTSYYIEK